MENGISRPADLAVDANFIYVPSESKVFTYAMPLKREAPTASVRPAGSTIGVAVSRSDLYVSTYYNAKVYDYSLPLTSASTPVAVIKFPRCTLSNGFNKGYGLAVYPPPQAGKPATLLFAADSCNNVFTYSLPLSSGEKPILDTVTTGYFPLYLYAR